MHVILRFNLEVFVNDNIAGTSIYRVSLNEADVQASKKIYIRSTVQ